MLLHNQIAQGSKIGSTVTDSQLANFGAPKLNILVTNNVMSTGPNSL